MNLTFTNNLLLRVPAVHAIISADRGLLLNLEDEGLDTIVLVMFSAIWAGIDDKEQLLKYLRHSRARVDSRTVDFLLDAFEGDDCRRHLWQRGQHGNFKPLFEAMPDHMDYLPDDHLCGEHPDLDA